MAIQASTDERTEFIYESLQAQKCMAVMQIEKYNRDNSSWELIEDLDVESGIDFTQSTKVPKYGNFGLSPSAGTVDFKVNNFLGIYSPDSGDRGAGFLDIGDRVRLKGGYYIPDTTDGNTATADLDGSNTELYYARYSGGKVYPDMNNLSGHVDNYFKDFFKVGEDLTYADLFSDSVGYTPSGYAAFTYDTGFLGATVYTSINLTTNTAGWRVYYRTYNYQSSIGIKTTSASWTLAGYTTGGSDTFTISKSARYIQVAIIMDGVNWTTDATIDALSVDYSSYIEWVFNSVYTLDKVAYDEPAAPKIPKIKCKGRDAYGKAIEQETKLKDINGLYLQDVIKYMCDLCGIKYNATSIADLTDFGVRALSTGLDKSKKCNEVFEWVMAILNKTSTVYTMYLKYDSTLDDNIMYVKPAPNIYTADFVLDYKNYSSIGAREKDTKSYVQRFLIQSGSGQTDSDVLLNTQVVTADGSYTITWSGNAAQKYLLFDRTDGLDVTVDDWGATSITLTITGVDYANKGDLNITVRGEKWKAGEEPTYWGEFAHGNNMMLKLGKHLKAEIPLISSTAEADAVTEELTNRYGNQFWEIKNCKWPFLNLFLDLNDMALMWTRYLWVDDLHFIVNIDHHWDWSDKPNQSTSYKLFDSGINFRDIDTVRYDNNKPVPVGQELLYNTGWVYDMYYTTLQKDSDIPDSEFQRDVDEA